MFVPDVCVHCEAVGGGGGLLIMFMRSFCRSLKDGVGSEVLRFDSAALMRVAARHVTLVTHGDGGWGQTIARWDGIRAQQLWGRPIRRQNNQRFSLWLCPCGPPLSSPGPFFCRRRLAWVWISTHRTWITSFSVWLFFDLVCFEFPCFWLFMSARGKRCVAQRDKQHVWKN